MADKAHPYEDLFRYNRWANLKVFAACREVDPSQLRGEAPGTESSIEGTLKHLIGVEDVYLLMLRDQLPNARGSLEEYLGHDLEWFAARADQLGEDYVQLLAALDDALLASPLRVPWFDFPITKHEGLLQVLTHSAQHRSQVLSVLGARGISVPNVDYVFMLQERWQAGSH